MKLQNTRLRSLLDTGSHHSLLCEDTARKLKVPIDPLTEKQSLFSANGSPLQVIGQSTIALCISSLKVYIDVLIVKQLSEMLILGRSFLQQGSAVLNFANNTVTFNQLIEIPLYQVDKNASLARLTQGHCVPGNSEIICNVSCHSRFNNNDILLTPIPGKQFGAYAVANTCSTVHKNQTVCRILNFNDTPLVLCKNQKIGQIQEFTNDQNCMTISQNQNADSKTVESDEDENLTEQQLNEFAEQYNFNINTELTEQVRFQLLRVLYRRRSAFARNLSELKIYNKELFEIKLKDTSPMIQKQFPLKEEHARILEEHISDWLKDDIIEPSKDYFHNNPIFLVAKQGAPMGTQGAKKGPQGASNKLDKSNVQACS